MKTVTTQTPQSSVKSTTTADGGDATTGYYPGCRKDANCSCDICLASINATLDLMPQSIQRNTFSNNPISRMPISGTPLSFDSSISTPKSRVLPVRMASLALKSTARMRGKGLVKDGKGKIGFLGGVLRFVLFSGVLFGLYLWGFRVLKTEFSEEMVRNLGEGSWGLSDLNDRVVFLKKELVKNLNDTSFLDFKWEIIQDGLLLNSRFTLYKTAMEEVSVWGWPLQTAGLLTTTFSSKSFTILSGRVTEWTNGKAGYLVRKSNTSWMQGKWSASAVQIDGNTWILEYKRSGILENANLLSAAYELLEFSVTRKLHKIKQKFWLSSNFGKQYWANAESSRIPT